jgi:hypothetical protein
MDVLPAFVFVCHPHAVSTEDGEAVDSPGTGVTHGLEPPCGCWELNLGPLQEQPVLLTTEPSLQPLIFFPTISTVHLVHFCLGFV